MDAVTYPDEEVAPLVNENFAPLKIDMLAKHPDFREACAGQKVIWAPTLIISDPKGRELRRWTGWLPPTAFMAELRFALATAQFQAADFVGARDAFEAVFVGNESSAIAPEALYWIGIAGFLAGKRDMGALQESWTRLVEEYPDTRWATHATPIEDAKAR